MQDKVYEDKLFHPVLDQELIGLPCLYCNVPLSRMNNILFCPYCRIKFIKEDKDNGITSDHRNRINHIVPYR